MRTSLFPLAGLVPALLAAPVHGQAPGVPVLATPGTATWASETISTGTRTVFKITGNSIFDWNGFDLQDGSELVFDFIGGDSVVNMLNGTGVHILAGTVTSNGNVGFFSPDADLLVTGSVTANSVTMAALDVDTAAFSGTGTFSMSGAADSFNGLTVTGQIRATGGDVVLAGKAVEIGFESKLQAKGAALIAGGTEISVARSGSGQRLKQGSASGFVLHMGDTRASRIEVAAGEQITNQGRLDVGRGGQRIFLEVGKNGKIARESSGIIVGNLSVNGKVVTKGSSLKPNEGDAASVISTSSLKMPALKRPDGSVAAKSRTVVNHAPISASADGGRDRKQPPQQVAGNGRGGKPMLQRASFFGMRGGDSTVKR